MPMPMHAMVTSTPSHRTKNWVSRLANRTHPIEQALPASSRWQVGPGVTHIPANAHLRKADATNSGSPTLLNFKIDTYMTLNTYLTGQAYTAFAGHAGGFQISSIGAGYRLPVDQKWSSSAELILGVGGGAGIDANGGALGAAYVDFDYELSDSLSIFAGAG